MSIIESASWSLRRAWNDCVASAVLVHAASVSGKKQRLETLSFPNCCHNPMQCHKSYSETHMNGAARLQGSIGGGFS